ncbi:MAG TPA: sigma-70 family RNA polymerase sigma factor, partial [Kineosporiaceae bacterium]|nr:sigma-70 family RNA polymerase sigma factor [Kineosporiaceae bacterium]
PRAAYLKGVRAADLPSWQRPPLYLDQPADEAPEYTLGDTVPDPQAHIEQATDRLQLEALLSRLPARTRFAVEAVYLHGMTMKTAGVHLGVTEARVSQLCSAALKQMRAAATA